MKLVVGDNVAVVGVINKKEVHNIEENPLLNLNNCTPLYSFVFPHC